MESNKDKGAGKEPHKLSGKIQFALLATSEDAAHSSAQSKSKSKSKTVRKRKYAASTQQTPQMDEKVKEIGRKARMRLEEEKSKRKEIVRLDEGIAIINTSARTSNKISTFSKAVKKSSQVAKKQKQPQPSRKRRNVTTASSRKAKTKDQDSNIDTWAPSTASLRYYDLPKAEKSNIVRLHGLPLGAKVDHIRIFFGALSPERIFILPSMNVPIAGFDSDGDDDSRQRSKGAFVDRYVPTFRVYVQFESLAAADVAIGRSGEVIHVDGAAAAISISPMSKRVAIHLQNHMAIECSKAIPIEDALKNAEKDIPTVIIEILWVMAARNLDLDLNLSTIGGGEDFPCIRTNEIANIFPPLNEQSRRNIMTLHNKLLDVYEVLEHQCSPLQLKDTFFIDPSFVALNSSHRLKITAMQWLLDQMGRITKCIAHKREA